MKEKIGIKFSGHSRTLFCFKLCALMEANRAFWTYFTVTKAIRIVCRSFWSRLKLYNAKATQPINLLGGGQNPHEGRQKRVPVRYSHLLLNKGGSENDVGKMSMMGE